MSVERLERTFDNRQLYPDELQTATGSMAFTILRNRFEEAEPTSGAASKGALSRHGSISITRSTLAMSSVGTAPVNLASAWPRTRSNRWVFDLFAHERISQGDDILVPAQISYGTIGAFTSDNDDLPEGELDLEPSRIPIRLAGVWSKITAETFEDYRGFDSWAHSELTRRLLSEIDNQLLNGDGVKPSLSGLLNDSNIQSQSKSSDTLTVAISKAFSKVLTAGFYPTAIIVSPDDFAALVTTESVGFAGTFLGVPLIASEHVENNLPVVGDFTAATVFERTALEFEMTNYDQDSFVMNIRTIRGTQRLALAVFSPKAFCKVVA